jgi:transcriptional regulator of heat shock response
MCAVVFKRMCTPLLHRRKNNKMAGADENLVSETFDKYADNGKMGAEGLLRFLHEEQGEGKATLEDANNLLQQQRKEISKLPKLRSQDMKMDDFFQFLVNPRLNGPITTQVRKNASLALLFGLLASVVSWIRWWGNGSKA